MLFILGGRSYVISGNKQQNNIAKLEERKAFIDSIGTKDANLKDKFFLHVFAAFLFP